MTTFISYSSDDKNLAAIIKSCLDKYGFNCFLAHQNILPQAKWPVEIEEALRSCDLFLPILTPAFKASYFCQQEVGFACCKKVEVLPVLISEVPMGLMFDIQGVKFKLANADECCWKIVDHIAKRSAISAPVLDALIKWFGESESYDTAVKRAKKVLVDYPFTDAHVRQIKEHIESNSQINETKEARDVIMGFMDKYPDQFNDKIKRWYDSREASRRWMRC